MRTLKFRIWETIENKMLYPDDVENDLKSKDWPTVLAIGLHGLPIVVDKDSFKKEGQAIGWNVDHNRIIMQSTGKFDSTGKEVYDGDIIEFDRKEWGADNNIHIVSWNETEAAWCFGGGTANDMGWRKVIGNIYETPDLVPTE